MDGEVTRNWKKKMYRVGTFGDYSMHGFQYENELSEVGWHITAWLPVGPIHDYWVSDKKFYSMRIHFFYNLSNRTLIEIFGILTNLSSQETDAVMLAISVWEGETELESLGP